MRRLVILALFLLLFLAGMAQNTPTPNLGLNRPAKGTIPWDVLINSNFTLLDQIFTLATCGDSSHAVSWNATTKTFGCVSISAGGAVASVAGKTGAVTLAGADIVSGTIDTARLGSGPADAGKLLCGSQAWCVLALSHTPLTTGGDLLYADGSPNLARLPVGADGHYLYVNNSTHLPFYDNQLSNLANALTYTGAVGFVGKATNLTAAVDAPTAIFHRYGPSQTSNVLEIRAIDESVLMSIGKTGIVTAPSFIATDTNGGMDYTEGTGAGVTCASGHDVIWADSTAHRFKICNNNGTVGNVMTSTDQILTAQIAANAVTSAKLAVVNTYKTCSIVIGADNGAALVDGDLGPQLKQCQVNAPVTVVEIDIAADNGTPSVIVSKRHCTVAPCVTGANETVTNLVSSALSTASSGGTACSKTAATAGLDTFTTCAATLQNTSLAVGDWFGLVSGTSGGVAQRMSIDIHYTVN